MKKVFLSIALAATLFLSSCIGSFGLTNKVYNWNKSVGSPFVNEIVFLAFSILPVYELSVVADAFVINSIEFWTGQKIVAQNTEVIETENGKYLVEANEDGYTITQGDETVQFITQNGVWFVKQGETITPMFSYADDNHICLNMGETTTLVELSQDGVDNFREMYVK